MSAGANASPHCTCGEQKALGFDYGLTMKLNCKKLSFGNSANRNSIIERMDKGLAEKNNKVTR